jgi:hypothetical protein
MGLDRILLIVAGVKHWCNRTHVAGQLSGSVWLLVCRLTENHDPRACFRECTLHKFEPVSTQSSFAPDHNFLDQSLVDSVQNGFNVGADVDDVDDVADDLVLVACLLAGARLFLMGAASSHEDESSFLFLVGTCCPSIHPVE